MERDPNAPPQLQGLRTARRLMIGVAVAIGLGAMAAGWSHLSAIQTQAGLERIRATADEAQRLMTAVSEAEGQFRAYLLHPVPDRRDRLERAIAQLEGELAADVATAMQDTLGNSDALLLRENLRRMTALRRRGLALLAEGRQDVVIDSLRHSGAQMTTDETHDLLSNFLHDRNARATALQDTLDHNNTLVMDLVVLFSLVTLLAIAVAWTLIRRRSLQAEEARLALSSRGEQMEALLHAGDMLQACESLADVVNVATHTAQRLLPDAPGALYLFSNSRDRLDLATSWAGEAGRPGNPPAHPSYFAPDACWALRRGRPHRQGDGRLFCAHFGDPAEAGADRSACVCIPMQARGEIHGLFCLEAEGPAATAAPALADAMSLALANLHLRERLRAQALRDPLTGLFNRRYLEEAGQGLLHQSARRGAPVSVALLDADHFKRVNDVHGHATGDAVLRSLAGVLQGSLRRSDISCRFGGEEFLLLLPDCDASDAERRMNEVRQHVERMRHGTDGLPPITVSIGIAAIPGDAATLEEAIARADAALYTAKALGRNRTVRALPPSAPAEARMETRTETRAEAAMSDR